MNLGHEDERKEFKRSTSELKEGVASIASMLNKHGSGELYFGVNKDGDVCGQDVSESTLREISQAIGNSIQPTIYPEIAHETTPEGKNYILVSFSGDDAPYACNGKYRIRVADEDILMSPEQLRRRFRELEDIRNPWDRRVSDKTVEDVDEPTLRSFIERGRAKGRITFAYTTPADALERLGLVKDGMLLNAAVALFCPNPITDLKMAVFASHARTDIVGLQHESGILFDMVEKAEMFVISNTRSRVDTSTPGASDVYPEIPIKALHEGLMNAYAHRDWQRGAVMVEIYNDAVEIISPGWFIEGQDPDEHLAGKSVSSESRNGLIASTLFKSGDIEAQGTGIKRIKDYCDEANIKVEYVHTVDGTKLVFHRNDAFGQSLVIDAAQNNVSTGTLNGTLSGTLKLNERNQKVVEIISESPDATAEQIASDMHVGLRTVRRALKELQEQGIIYREGSRKTGKWIIRDHDEQMGKH